MAVKSVRNRDEEAVVQGGAHRGPRPGETVALRSRGLRVCCGVVEGAGR